MVSTIATIVQLLLGIVSLLLKKANDSQIREIGRNEVIQQQLQELATRTGIAKQIAEDWSRKSDSDVDKFLRDKFRD